MPQSKPKLHIEPSDIGFKNFTWVQQDRNDRWAIDFWTTRSLASFWSRYFLKFIQERRLEIRHIHQILWKHTSNFMNGLYCIFHKQVLFSCSIGLEEKTRTTPSYPFIIGIITQGNVLTRIKGLKFESPSPNQWEETIPTPNYETKEWSSKSCKNAMS